MFNIARAIVAAVTITCDWESFFLPNSYACEIYYV